MFRWESVEETEIFDMTVKMYRPIFEAEKIQKVPYQRTEIDKYAFDHLGSEVYTYMVLDINWTEYMEARGDVDKFSDIYIPAKEQI